MKNRRGELGIPPNVEQDPNALEILRAWLANKSLICAVQPQAFSAHTAITGSPAPGAAAWGIVLADVARHVTGAMYELHDKEHSETIAEILRVFNEELTEPRFEMAGSKGQVDDIEGLSLMDLRGYAGTMQSTFIDHIVIVVRELHRTTQFYSVFLGKPIHQDNESIAYQIGQTKLFFVLPYGEFNKTDKDLGSLNHLAFGVRTADELRVFEKALNEAKIENSGIKVDKYGNKEFIWFDDPDGYRVEFYCRPYADLDEGL